MICNEALAEWCACPGSEYRLHEGLPCLFSLEYIFYHTGYRRSAAAGSQKK